MAFQFNQFRYLAEQQNSHFERFKSSSLHALMKAVKQNDNAGVIKPLVAAIPDDKKKKYAAALTYLQNEYPGMSAPTPQVRGIAVMPGGAPALKPVNVQALEGRLAPPAPALPPLGGLTELAGVRFQNYTMILDPHPFTALTAGTVGPLGPTEIARLNEAVMRSNQAATAAVTALSKINGPIPTVGATLDQRLYKAYFGPYDKARRTTVLKNFMAIQQAVDGSRGGTKGSLQVIDSRNDAGKLTWFAATFRNSAGGGEILMYVGREFFLNATAVGFNTSTDFTVGTVIHELSHACFGASDVPTVAAGGKSQLDGTGMPLVGSVCNDADSDKDLAADDPDAALLNADNYGQFAWRMAAKAEP